MAEKKTMTKLQLADSDLVLETDKKVGVANTLAKECGVSAKSVRCALRAQRSEVSANYVNIRAKAIELFSAYPVKKMRVRV